MALIHLIYVSSAIKEQTDAELNAILEGSVRRNKVRNITGMLLYAEGSFLQVLEGEEIDIEATFGRIEKDTRHNGLIILEREIIPFRSFEQWYMGFYRITAADVVDNPGYAPFFERGFNPKTIGALPGTALDILLNFSECYKDVYQD